MRTQYLLFILTIFISCNKVSESYPSIKDVKISFEIRRPSSHYVTDGAISLKIEPEIELKSVIWKIRSYNYDYEDYTYTEILSTNRDIQNLSTGEYFLIITDMNDSIFRGRVFLASYDTIYPKEYYPAYSGSWWYYSNGDTIKCADTYEKCAVRKNYQDQDYPIDYVYVPVVDGCGIFGYSYLGPSNITPAAIEDFFCDEKNCYLSASGYYPLKYPYMFGHNINSDTTLTIQNKLYHNVMIVTKYYTVHHHSDTAYYAKNIGLIKFKRHDFYDTNDIEYELIDYKVNNK